MTDQTGTTPAAVPPMRAQDYSEALDWPGYFAAVRGKEPRETLVAALDAFARDGVAEGLAVDIAAGEGRDTLELLRRGWRVVATDGHPDAFTHLWPRVPEQATSRLSTLVATFADTPVCPCELVNASYALPFCDPGDFAALWGRIVAAIRPGGRFAGQFFGDRDSWAVLPGRSHHSEEAVRRLFEGFEIELFRVEERDDPPDVRNPKHWHLFHVVARKS